MATTTAAPDRPSAVTASYAWVPGRGYSKVSAQDVGEFVTSGPAGIRTASEYVAAARPKDSPLHHSFTWDDTAEAQLWREHGARGIMAAVRVVVDGVQESAPAFVSVRVIDDHGDQSGGYMATVRAMSEQSSREYVLREARRQFQALADRHRSLVEFASLITAVDEMLESPE